MNFWSSFTRSKSREEIELQQGTPEVQNISAKLAMCSQWKQSGSKMQQPEKTLRGIQLRKFSELPECQIQRCNYSFYICVWHYGSSQAGHTGSSFYVPEVHYICTWHSGRLVCTSGVPCCRSVSTLLLLLVNYFKNSYCANGGTEKSETTSRLLV